MTIEPAGFEETHARGGREHRLRSGESSDKWLPLGVGTIEPDPEKPKQLTEPSDDEDGS
jgi:hypothetical protein